MMLKKRFYTLNYDKRRRKRPLIVEKKENLIKLMKDEKSGKIVINLAAVVPRS